MEVVEVEIAKVSVDICENAQNTARSQSLRSGGGPRRKLNGSSIGQREGTMQRRFGCNTGRWIDTSARKMV